ncbi:MAG TPA: SDR family oxidoreductase [Candidatus Thermoplasmatota archaeon]|nr:SDR family oxidoreductase [Candidatus Thermoplasmatota archaeon]
MASANPAPTGPRSALVTGATSGIGEAVATGLAREGLHVTLLVRDQARGEAARQRIAAKVPGAKTALLLGDLSDQTSVRNAAAEFRQESDRLDVLVHCAGVFLPKRQVTVDGVEATLATNYLGPFLLTNELLPMLRKSSPSRVVSVASRYGGAKLDFDDLNFEKREFSYLKVVPRSKLAQVLFTQELAERLSGTGVTVNAIHPGLVKGTKLLSQTGGPFRVITNLVGGSPEKGADTALWLATAKETEHVTGGLWAKRKIMKTPGQGSDPAARKRLWEESEKMIGNAASMTSKPQGKDKAPAKAKAVVR